MSVTVLSLHACIAVGVRMTRVLDCRFMRDPLAALLQLAHSHFRLAGFRITGASQLELRREIEAFLSCVGEPSSLVPAEV